MFYNIVRSLYQEVDLVIHTELVFYRRVNLVSLTPTNSVNSEYAIAINALNTMNSMCSTVWTLSQYSLQNLATRHLKI